MLYNNFVVVPMTNDTKAGGKEEYICLYPIEYSDELEKYIKEISEKIGVIDEDWKAWMLNFIISDYGLIDFVNWYEIHNYELMEWNGKKDKNDKDIYEGDIIKCGKFIYEVYYNEKLTSYWIRNDEYECPLSHLINYEIEVISHIYVYKKELK